jgi:predicted extracellular nuclease
MPFADATYPERFEGMLVRLPQPLVISEYFNYERFGEMVLALPLDGETRPFTPTSIDEPGAPALARALANSLRRITLDDALSGSNPSSLRHPMGGILAGQPLPGRRYRAGHSGCFGLRL